MDLFQVLKDNKIEYLIKETKDGKQYINIPSLGIETYGKDQEIAVFESMIGLIKIIKR